MEALRAWVMRALAWCPRAWNRVVRTLSPLLRRGWASLLRAARGVEHLLSRVGREVRRLSARIDYRPFYGHGALWRALIYAVLISGALLWLCAGWFGVAGVPVLLGLETRHGVSLQESVSSWVAGLTASGAAGVVYWLWHLILGRRAARVGRDHRAPTGFDLWLMATPLLVTGTLLLAHRGEAAPGGAPLAGLIFSLLVGVGLVAAPGEAIALRPRTLGWPLVEGALLAIPLAWGRLIANVLTDREGLPLAAVGDGGGLLLATGLLAAITWLRRRTWRPRWPTPQASIAAGLCLAYAVTPLVLAALSLAGIVGLPAFAAGSFWLRWVTLAAIVALGVALDRWRDA